MSIAIYHGFSTFHYEMLGYLIDYFITTKISINIYSHNNIISLDWKEQYQKIFNVQINFLNPQDFNPDNYKLIILVTDDDNSFTNLWIEEHYHKIICIDHNSHLRRSNKMYHLATRFFYERPSCDWALPCYQIINKINKQKLLNDNNKIHVLCIGQPNIPPSTFFLSSLFENFNEIDFHIISRQISQIYDDCTNIYKYENCSTTTMFQLLQKAQYILCVTEGDHINKSMSGAVPLSFNFGCQLIIPKSWQYYYKFSSAISYTSLSKLKLTKDIQLEPIYNELYYFISRRNHLFDIQIQKRFNIIQNNIESRFGKACLKLNISIPNIFITFKKIENTCDDFRENHILDTQYDELMINNKTFIYSNNCLEKILNNIRDSFVIYENNLDNIENTLSILNKSILKNIIFIDIPNDELILKDIILKISNNYIKPYAMYRIDDLILVIRQ